MAEKYLHTAYLLSRYPAISHTFFLQEIKGLRDNGMHIETASINSADRAYTSLSDDERTESTTTFYIKQVAKPRLVSTLLATALLHPMVVLRGLKAALELNPWHLMKTLYALFYLVEAIVLGRWMKDRGLKHLHVHFSGPVASVGMITALAWQIPYSLTVHGPDEFFDQHETALAQKIHAAGIVVCISDYCRSQLMRISAPDTWNKFLVVRLGIGPALANAAIVSKMPHTPFTILCTGRLVSAKGQAILLMAAAELLRRGHVFHLVFIGNGEDRGMLEAISTDSGMSNYITFSGAQNHDRTLEQLRESDLFVLPSFAEGVPVALMEAMAIGVPCISTFVAGIPELIRHEQDGLLVPAGSVLELTTAIERLILHDDDRLRFRISARERVLAHYNLPENLKLLSRTFAEHLPQQASSNLPSSSS